MVEYIIWFLVDSSVCYGVEEGWFLEIFFVEIVGLRGGDYDLIGGVVLLGCLCDRELEFCVWVIVKNIIKFYCYLLSIVCILIFV